MVPEIITNLSEEQLHDSYLGMLQTCEDCKIIHRSCFVKVPCADCEHGFFVRNLAAHFGEEIPK